MIGVIATSGTERSTIAAGMNVDSADGDRLKKSATSTATDAPANRAEAGVGERGDRRVPELLAGVGAHRSGGEEVPDVARTRDR